MSRSLRDYITEAEAYVSGPVAGDEFDIEIAPGDIVSTYVLESTEDSITVYGDETMMSLLETIRRYGAVGSNRAMGYSLGEASLSDLDVERQDYERMSPQEFQRAYGKSKPEWQAEYAQMFNRLQSQTLKTMQHTQKKDPDYCDACDRPNNRCVCESEVSESVNAKQIKKDLDSGMSYDAVIGKHANKRMANTDEIRRVIQQHAWEKRTKQPKTKQGVAEGLINEDLSNFTAAGIPAEFAKNILRKYNFDHDVAIEPMQSKPKTSDVDRGDMIINLLPSGDVIAMLKRNSESRFSAPYNVYHRLEIANGQFTDKSGTSAAAASKGMTSKGKFFRIHNKYFGTAFRGDKPTPDEVKDRSTADPLAGSDEDIYGYMNDTFMPRMRQQMEAMVDDIYANLRKLDKNKDQWGGQLSIRSPNQQQAAIEAAANIEQIAERGFNRSTMERFLSVFGKRHHGFASYPRNEQELRKLLKNEPNARAKWAKIVLDSAKEEYRRVKEMVAAPVMKALQKQGVTEDQFFQRVLELAGCGRKMEEEVNTTDPLAAKAAALAPVSAQGSAPDVNIDEGAMKGIAAELGEIADTEDFDRLYDLMTATSPAGEVVQRIADDVAIDNRLGDDDHEELLELVMDRLIDEFGGYDLDEAEYQGRNVELNKPMQGDVKKFKVYVKDPTTGNVKKVNFGDKTMRIKKSNPARRRSFRARHNCDNPGPKTKARYWSCRKW
jgi:hypothetical protein